MQVVTVDKNAAITIFEADNGYVVHVAPYRFRSYNCISECEGGQYVCKTRVEVGRLVVDRLARCEEHRDADEKEMAKCAKS